MSLVPTVRVVLRNALPALALAMVCMTASAPAQSLGDVARQEQARRKTASSGKVYTNGDLRGSPEAATTAPASTGGTPTGSTKSSAATNTPADAKADAKGATKSDSAAAADGKNTDSKSTDGKSADGKSADGKSGDTAGDKTKSREAEEEAAWRKRQATIQESLDRARTFADALQSRINGLTAEFSAKDDPAQRGLVGAERQKALTELDRVKKEIQQHTQALDDLHEEARRAGVPPGWLR